MSDNAKVTLTREQARHIRDVLEEVLLCRKKLQLIDAEYVDRAQYALSELGAALTRAQQEPAPCRRCSYTGGDGLRVHDTGCNCRCHESARPLRCGELPTMAADLMPQDGRPARKQQEPAATAADPFDKIGADRLADEVAVLILRGVIDSRSLVGDALHDYADARVTERARKLFAERGHSAARIPLSVATMDDLLMAEVEQPVPATPPACCGAEVLRAVSVNLGLALQVAKTSTTPAAAIEMVESNKAHIDAALSRCAGTGEWELVKSAHFESGPVRTVVTNVPVSVDAGSSIYVYHHRAKAGERR